jgi:cadmium resistance protein CadD (predicted permease)
MDHLLALVSIAVVAFVSTNIDDLVLLIGFFANPAYRPAHVVAGQFAGISGLIGLSLVGSLLALVIPTAYIGLIGFLPIAIGLRQLWRGGTDGSDDVIDHAKRASRIGTVMLVTLSNGGDNLSLYVPLFSIHTVGEIALFVALFLVMTALWCCAGYALVKNPLVSAPLQRWGHLALPYVMIALGAYILVKTDALALLGVPISL